MILVPFPVPVTMIAEALREIFCSTEDSVRSRISYARFSRVALFWSVFGGSFQASDVGPYSSIFIFTALFVMVLTWSAGACLAAAYLAGASSAVFLGRSFHMLGGLRLLIFPGSTPVLH